jgi:hypothetical protein
MIVFLIVYLFIVCLFTKIRCVYIPSSVSVEECAREITCVCVCVCMRECV